MKEIKFRVWDKQFNIWVNPEIVALWAMYVLDNPGSVAHDIMQFTGLCDKNGKEIYEGDILTETVNECRWIYEVRTVKEYGNNLYKVTRYRNFKHDDDGEQIFGDFWLNEGWSQLTGRYEEVIGNIYENPELLTHENASTPKSMSSD